MIDIKDETFDGTFPFVPHYLDTNGFEMHFADEGSGEPALLGTTYRPENLTAAVMDAYRAPFPTPESRRALVCWSRDIPVDETDPSYAEMRRIEGGLGRLAGTPTLLVWGMRDPVLPESILRIWQRTYPQAITKEIDEAGHFVQEDAPEQTVGIIEEFLNANA